jgi:hypothetical protein
VSSEPEPLVPLKSPPVPQLELTRSKLIWAGAIATNPQLLTMTANRIIGFMPALSRKSVE